MSHVSDPDPLSGPTDDDPDTTKPATASDIPEKTDDDDGSEWIPVPVPTDGDGPLP